MQYLIPAILHNIQTSRINSYTDNKGTDESSWEPQLVAVGNQATTNDGSCIAGKCELQHILKLS
jgi:hypothetical protein